MRGSLKSRRVSWASDVNLCQVRLFLSEESPSQVGNGNQDHLQSKTPWTSHPPYMGSDDHLPPGFEGMSLANSLSNRFSQIPCSKWRCPPKFALDLTWQVVAGEESKEMEDENQREMRVLEAVYPRPSAIPPNPLLLAGMDNSYNTDQQVPLIPITPIEDEDATADAPSDIMAQNATAMISHPYSLAPGTSASHHGIVTDHNPTTDGTSTSGLMHGMSPEILATTYAALSTATSNSDLGNLIDHDLLLKVLSDPKYIEKLASGQGHSINQNIVPKSMSSGIMTPDPHPVHTKRMESITPSAEAAPSRPLYPPPPRMEPVPAAPIGVSSAPMGVPATRDMNYYKRLIQQHGGEKQETGMQPYGGHHNHHSDAVQESINSKPRDFRPKIMKPCMFFNSPRGCRNGANCTYQHVATPQYRVPEVQNSKRMKLDEEISGV